MWAPTEGFRIPNTWAGGRPAYPRTWCCQCRPMALEPREVVIATDPGRAFRDRDGRMLRVGNMLASGVHGTTEPRDLLEMAGSRRRDPTPRMGHQSLHDRPGDGQWRRVGIDTRIRDHPDEPHGHQDAQHEWLRSADRRFQPRSVTGEQIGAWFSTSIWVSEIPHRSTSVLMISSMFMKTRMRITNGGQISIPAAIRHRWSTSTVVLDDQGGRIVIEPAPDDPIAAAEGALAGEFGGLDVARLRRVAREDERGAEERRTR